MKSEHSDTPDVTKKPYASPRVSVYGDIREITQAAGTSSNKPDGAGGQINKTA